MKRFKTDTPNIWLYGNGGYYYRKGKLELSLNTKDLEQAKRNKAILEAKTQAFGATSFKFTVNDVLPAYLRFAEENREYRVRTKKEIADLWRLHLSKYFGKKKLSDIDEYLWNQFTARRDVNDYANLRKVLNLFLKWCRENRYYYARPLFSLPKHKRRRRRILTNDQILLVFEHAQGGFLLFAVLTLIHSMRTKEAISIKVPLINFQNKAVWLADEFVKTGKGRWVTLNELAIDLMKQKIALSRSKGIRSDYLYPNRKDPKRHMDPTGFKTAWNTVKRKAGGPLDGYTVHDFRATFEKFSHKDTSFTDTQKEKFSGASMEIQKSVYVTMTADDVRGLENAVKVPGLDDVIRTKIHSISQIPSGKSRGDK